MIFIAIFCYISILVSFLQLKCACQQYPDVDKTTLEARVICEPDLAKGECEFDDTNQAAGFIKCTKIKPDPSIQTLKQEWDEGKRGFGKSSSGKCRPLSLLRTICAIEPNPKTECKTNYCNDELLEKGSLEGKVELKYRNEKAQLAHATTIAKTVNAELERKRDLKTYKPYDEVAKKLDVPWEEDTVNWLKKYHEDYIVGGGPADTAEFPKTAKAMLPLYSDSSIKDNSLFLEQYGKIKNDLQEKIWDYEETLWGGAFTKKSRRPFIRWGKKININMEIKLDTPCSNVR